MSKNPHDWLLEDLEVVEKQALVQRYLQSPFSLTWSHLAALLSPPGESLLLAKPPISGGNRSVINKMRRNCI